MGVLRVTRWGGGGGGGVEIRKIHHDRQWWAKSKKEIDIEPPSAIQKTTIVTKLLREEGEASKCCFLHTILCVVDDA